MVLAGYRGWQGLLPPPSCDLTRIAAWVCGSKTLGFPPQVLLVCKKVPLRSIALLCLPLAEPLSGGCAGRFALG